MKYWLLSLSLFALVPFVASSHGAAKTIPIVVDQYTVRIGQDPEILTAGETIHLEFGFIEGQNEKPSQDYKAAWVRILRKDTEQVLLTTRLYKDDFSEPGISYVFSESGEYEVNVRFERENAAPLEALTTLRVEKQSFWSTNEFIYLLSGLSIGLVLSILIFRYFYRAKPR